MENIKVILLDIGNVLVELSGAPKLIELMDGNITKEELDRRWINSQYVTLFETGKCDEITFAKGLVSELKMNISPENFLKEFVLFTKRLFPGIPELLVNLRSKYVLACLSNTNLTHWNVMCERFSLDKYFDRNFLSFEIGSLKPDCQIYEYVKKNLECNPDKIAFFDDNMQNVQAANIAGMQAYRVIGAENLKQKLTELKLMY